ncbi:hypothetical protein T01_9368 [Trichinella spiralis]|uniref:Uncharacterized protein n=2 Tax=Trichinella spiralis TaxID=6334 RepID=A0A0V1BWB9_TRISP|nr:hypothetical protein T01_9368 [Trichinella spiralis]
MDGWMDGWIKLHKINCSWSIGKIGKRCNDRPTRQMHSSSGIQAGLQTGAFDALSLLDDTITNDKSCSYDVLSHLPGLCLNQSVYPSGKQPVENCSSTPTTSLFTTVYTADTCIYTENNI